MITIINKNFKTISFNYRSSSDFSNELESLKIMLGINSNTDLIKHLVLNYKKILYTIETNPFHLPYKFYYSDGSNTTMHLTTKEVVDFKFSKQYCNFTNEDVKVIKVEPLF